MIGMSIEEASGKIRSKGVGDEEVTDSSLMIIRQGKNGVALVAQALSHGE